MPTRTQAIASAVGLATVLALMSAGCASPSGRPDTSTSALPTLWKQEFDQALADPNLSDFERQVLSKYAIAPGEYQEAKNLFAECMTNRGWTITWNTDDGYSITATPGQTKSASADAGSDAMACQVGTIGYIQPIYLGMNQNPQGKSSEQLIRDCYNAHQIADGDGLSDDAFKQMIDSIEYRPSSAQAALCFFDPTGAQGMTLEQAEALNQVSEQQVTVGPS